MYQKDQFEELGPCQSDYKTLAQDKFLLNFSDYKHLPDLLRQVYCLIEHKEEDQIDFKDILKDLQERVSQKNLFPPSPSHQNLLLDEEMAVIIEKDQ